MPSIPAKDCAPGLYSRRRPAETALYQVVQKHFETFRALCQDDWEGQSMPAYAEREFRRYLECGILAHGFVRARCDRCGHDFLVAFSCKGRGVCPSCNTRRMVETAAHLADHVFPKLPVRQWVVSFPKRLRYFLQRDGKVRSAALRIVLRIIEEHVRARSPGASSTARIGAVAFIHQFGSSLNEHTHFHICVIDGVFEATSEGGVAFFEATLDAGESAEIQTKIRRRVLRMFVQRGRIESEEAKAMLAWEHAGGFSVDASVRIEGPDRQGLERLLRYCARPPFALERIEMLDEHRLLYHLTKPMHDGRTCVRLNPLELIGRIAALVPAPRAHRHRYYGVLAPNARLRSAVTALIDDTQVPSETGPVGAEQPDGSKRSPARYLWAMLLARIYEAFPLACPVCGSPMTIIAFITDLPVVHHILDHIGEPSTLPRISPARGPPEWEGWDESSGQEPGFDPAPEYEFDQRNNW
jgi:uncharacterized Zn finger protein (UPF0148 family)